MALFGNKPFGTSSGLFGSNAVVSTAPTAVNNAGAAKDPPPIAVPAPPDDTVTALSFSPDTVPTNFLASSSWDSRVRCWEVSLNGQVQPKAEQQHAKPVFDLSWSDDGSKIFTGGADNTLKMWDLASNSMVQIGQHDAPIKTVHFYKTSTYQCVMSGSFDKTLRFWDARSPQPLATIQLPERIYEADVAAPMAVVATANRNCIVYSLDHQPKEFLRISDINLKYQFRGLAIFHNRKVAPAQPSGFAIGSIEGRAHIRYNQPQNPKDNFSFKCHRVDQAGNVQEIYPVHAMAFHPVHGTLATVGGDGRYNFWDKDNRTKVKCSDDYGMPITACCFSARGEIFAFGLGYDWSKGHEGFDASKKPQIYLTNCYEECKPKPKAK